MKYIIDDDMLATWRSGCIQWRNKNPDTQCHGCEYDNKVHRGCDFDDDAMQKIFQSNPLPDNDRGWEQGFQDGQTSALADCNVCRENDRRQVLKHLRDFIKSHEIEAGCSDMNEKPCQDHDCRCDLCNFDRAVESLKIQGVVAILDDQGCQLEQPPRCTRNHHNDDGTLIEYVGGGKPCSECQERQPCFEAFLKFRHTGKKSSQKSSAAMNPTRMKTLEDLVKYDASEIEDPKGKRFALIQANMTISKIALHRAGLLFQENEQ